MRSFRQATFVASAMAASVLLGAHSFTPTPSLPLGSVRRFASRKTDAFRLRMAVDLSDVRIMVNGMPGPMATAAAEACLRKGLELTPVAMTGPDVSPCTITVSDATTGKSTSVRLVPADRREEVTAAVEGLKEACGPDNLLAIDFTHPSAVNGNARFYAEMSIPFVMGTTGGDRDTLVKDMEEAGHTAVIAPNMAKQIVAIQAGLENLAERYPGAFAGYKISVVESHQKTKADTSGTAKAIVASLKELSDDAFEVEDIEMIRSDEESVAFGVPEEGLGGHAFHTYTFTSPDGSVEFQLKHNVVGRTVYAEGTADAVKFLAGKIRTGGGKKIYNMIDVLEAGVME